MKKIGLPLPRKKNNQNEINFDEIGSILILQNNNGQNKCVVASDKEGNTFYIEECTSDLHNKLIDYTDCQHIFSEITDNIKSGKIAESKLFGIKELLG